MNFAEFKRQARENYKAKYEGKEVENFSTCANTGHTCPKPQDLPKTESKTNFKRDDEE